MPFKEQKCVTVECDVCGDAFEYDFIPHFDSQDSAIEHVENRDGGAWQDKVWCEHHLPLCVCGHHYHYANECQDCTDENDCAEYQPAEAVRKGER